MSNRYVNIVLITVAVGAVAQVPFLAFCEKVEPVIKESFVVEKICPREEPDLREDTGIRNQDISARAFNVSSVISGAPDTTFATPLA